MDRRNTLPIALGLAALAALFVTVGCAFREHTGWGLAVLLGSGFGALLFTAFHPRQSLLPLFLMSGGLGGSWAARFAAVA